MNERTERLFAAFFVDHPELEPCRASLREGAELLIRTFREGGKVLVCGNGGSCSDAEHIVGELMKGFLLKRPLDAALKERFAERFGDEGRSLASRLQGALPAMALGAHTALGTAFANDVDGKLVFAQQVLGYGREGDLLIGISTSGNAQNVCLALMTARTLGLSTLALTGRGGGRAATLCDCLIAAPDDRTFRVQEHHVALYHMLCAAAESEFFAA